MTQWPIQRHVYTFIPQMNKSSQQDTTHILTTHNTNAPRLSTTTTTNHQQTTPSTSTFQMFDDSLTNLSWLHDINILKRTMPTINSSSTTNNKRKEQSSPSSSSAVYPNDISNTADLAVHHNLDDEDDEHWRFYKSNPQAKPVYSYAQLILLALKQSGHEKMTLQMIYEWVAENFPYFKKMEPTWQNSIRHNLSLNKCFVKVPRTKKETGTGKGGFWKLSSNCERQRSSEQTTTTSNNSLPNKRIRLSKRLATVETSSFNQIISDNVTPLMRTSSSSRISYENIKTESWIDPILPCLVSKNALALHCHPTTFDRSYVRMPSSFLSPTSSPTTLNIAPTNEFSAILTPSPSNSPSSSGSKSNFPPTKFDESDMLLLDSSTFDWDAYLCETPTDLDVQPLLTTKTEQDLFNDFHAALTDLTTSNETSTFDAFDYPTKNSHFPSLFDDDDQQQIQEENLSTNNTLGNLTVKGCGIRRPPWWIHQENVTATKLPSLESAFDLKLSK